MTRIHPDVEQAVKLANIGIIGHGNTGRDAALERDPAGWTYVEAADRCVAAASQVEDVVVNGIEVGPLLYGNLRANGYI